jgi:hypothetical protein
MKLKVGGALAVLLVGAAAVSVFAWRITGPSMMTAHGYIALGLCLVIGGGLAGGLMWLAFYSANHGYDDIDRER